MIFTLLDPTFMCKIGWSLFRPSKTLCEDFTPIHLIHLWYLQIEKKYIFWRWVIELPPAKKKLKFNYSFESFWSCLLSFEMLTRWLRLYLGQEDQNPLSRVWAFQLLPHVQTNPKKAADNGPSLAANLSLVTIPATDICSTDICANAIFAKHVWVGNS